MVRRPLSGKAIANEREYPYIVELLAADDKLDVDLSRAGLQPFTRVERFRCGTGGELSERAKSIFDGVFPIRTRPARSRNSSAEKSCNACFVVNQE
jgi:hypothetical protein